MLIFQCQATGINISIHDLALHTIEDYFKFYADVTSEKDNGETLSLEDLKNQGGVF